MTPTITLFYAGALALIFLGLSLQVVRLRRRFQVGIGSGGHEPLDRVVRAHGNFSEYVPLAVVLLVLVELGTALPAWGLHLLGAVLLLARLMHGFFGLNRRSGYSVGRFWGTALTWLVIAASALMLMATGAGRWLSA